MCKSLCKDILTAWEAHSKEKKSEGNVNEGIL